MTLYKKQYDEIGELARRMNTGLEKLIEASASVDQLSKELVVKEKDLAVANVKADKVHFYDKIISAVLKVELIIKDSIDSCCKFFCL